ncbi:phospholipase A2 [Nocardia sp. NPDC059180]|uniref:phospholipase A2 n=1 Tax=Nocardia sp. NPDC059180 TaxID=3346761 RepID=UPI0036863EDD
MIRCNKWSTVLVAAAAAIVVGTNTAAAGPLDRDQMAAYTDWALFDIDLDRFTEERNARRHGTEIDWSSDGCTGVTNKPLGRYDFTHACERHDFAYQNFRRQGRYNQPGLKQRFDNRFHDDMLSVCAGFDFVDRKTCQTSADTYWEFVTGRFGPAEPPAGNAGN